MLTSQPPQPPQQSPQPSQQMQPQQMQPQQTQPPQQQQQQLSSTTAPGKIFVSRLELQEHYKSDWHRYNLKRREAGLPLLNESDFQARLEAAMALRQERQKEVKSKSHLKDASGTGAASSNKKQYKKKKKQGGAAAEFAAVAQAAAYDRMKHTNDNNNEVAVESKSTTTTDHQQQPTTTTTTDGNNSVNDNKDKNDVVETMEEDNDEDEVDDPSTLPLPEIDPCQSLFDSYISPSVQENVNRMHQLYGFFIPDQEYLVDLEGLIGYCQEKIKLGHYCLYCQKMFRSWQACQQHMTSNRSLMHTKLKYERGIDLEELDPFYDFSTANEEFYQTAKTKRGGVAGARNGGAAATAAAIAAGDANDDNPMEVDNGDDWEDVSVEGDDDNEGVQERAVDDDDDDDDDDENLYAAYQDEIAKYGFDVTALGELILPDGRIIGHRGLARYYKQRYRQPSQQTNQTAVAAARLAAGERIVHGRVYQLHQHHPDHTTSTGTGTENNHALALLLASRRMPSSSGGSGQGVLVTAQHGGFTALSLYRYRAVLKKQRRDNDQGRRLQNRAFQNINRMDKKANRLMNGVSVAHALR